MSRDPLSSYYRLLVYPLILITLSCAGANYSSVDRCAKEGVHGPQEGCSFNGDDAVTEESPKPWYCELTPFKKTYSSYAASREAASQRAKQLCIAEHDVKHCQSLTCRLGP